MNLTTRSSHISYRLKESVEMLESEDRVVAPRASFTL